MTTINDRHPGGRRLVLASRISEVPDEAAAVVLGRDTARGFQ
jgi:hypothetical protein